MTKKPKPAWVPFADEFARWADDAALLSAYDTLVRVTDWIDVHPDKLLLQWTSKGGCHIHSVGLRQPDTSPTGQTIWLDGHGESSTTDVLMRLIDHALATIATEKRSLAGERGRTARTEKRRVGEEWVKRTAKKRAAKGTR